MNDGRRDSLGVRNWHSPHDLHKELGIRIALPDKHLKCCINPLVEVAERYSNDK